MPTFEDLISDISAELGGSAPSNLPFLIRSTEHELWQLLWFCGVNGVYSFNFPANTQSVALSSQVSNPRWILKIEALVDEHGTPLRRLGRSQFVRMSKRRPLGYPEYFFASPKEDTLAVCPTPSQDVSLDLVVWEREAPIQEGDTEQTKFFLGEGFEVLKWATLAKRLFNPDKWEFWRRNFADALHSLYISKGYQALSYRGGTLWHDTPTDY